VKTLVQTITSDQFAGQAGVYHYDPSTGTRSRASAAPAPALVPPKEAGSPPAAPVATAAMAGQPPSIPATSATPAPAANVASDNGVNAK